MDFPFLAHLFEKRNELDEAAGEYRKALATDPTCVNAHINLGNALLHKGDLDGAIAEYREAIRIQPDSDIARINLGIVLFK